MKNINITVENKRATVVGSPVIICGNSDYTVTFAFDSDWNVTGVRTARFVYVRDGKVQHEDVVFSGNTVAVPILSGIDSVKIGVFAGELRTTTPAVVRCGASILCGSGEVHEPTPDVYDQIMALFNDLAERGGFGATEAQAQQIAQNQTDIAALVSGTKKAGKAASADKATSADTATNASKLGGHASSYFAPLDRVMAQIMATGTDLNTCIKHGVYYLDGVASSYVNVPNAQAHNGVMIVSTYNEDNYNAERITQLYFSCNQGALYFRTSLGSVDGWRAWKEVASTADLANYLSKAGGTVNGSVTLSVDTATNLYSYLKNSLRSVFQYVSTTGAYALYDVTNDKAIITSLLDGTTTFNGTASGNLLLTGGVVNGNLIVDANNPHPIALANLTGDSVIPRYTGQSGTLGYLGFNGANNPVYGTSEGFFKTLHHDGNSAKVHIGTSAPSDTSALWIDTSA